MFMPGCLFAALIVLWIGTGAADAQPMPRPQPQQQPCGVYAEMAGVLADEWGELAIGQGLSGGAITELYANGATGTWTIIVAMPDGRACIVAVGEMWQAIKPAAGDPA